MLEYLASIDWATVGLWSAVVVLTVVGVVGTIVPALPGMPCIFAGAWLAAWIDHYDKIGTGTLIVLGVITVLGLIIDWCSQTLGAKRAGASSYGTAGALVGTVAGLFFGFIGIFFFPLVGAFVGELIHQKSFKVAGSVGIATWLGMLIGSAVKTALAFMMVGIMCFALLW